MSSDLISLSLLECPQCGSPDLDSRKDEFSCRACSAQYPILQQLPLLVPQPEQLRNRWAFGLRQQSIALDSLIEDLKVPAKEFPLPKSRKRIRQYRSALIARKAIFTTTLGAYENSAVKSGAAPVLDGAMQDLLHYYPNIIRDWSDAHPPAELRLQMEHVFGMMDSLPVVQGRCLIVGSGSSRLAYEIARRYAKLEVVAVDLNPFLLTVAQQVMDGVPLEAPDFVLAPMEAEHAIQMHTLKSPAPRPANLHLVVGDVFRLPFQPAAFDLIVTPWFVDIVQKSFFEVLAPLERVLKTGGHWLNFGTFYYEKSPVPLRFTPDELEDLLGESGWHCVTRTSFASPYLESPASSQQRIEVNHAFLARKEASATHFPRSPELRPQLAADLNEDAPVKLSPELQQQAELLAAEAKILSYFDGRRSLRQIAPLLIQDFGVADAEAIPLLKKFIARKRS